MTLLNGSKLLGFLTAIFIVFFTVNAHASSSARILDDQHDLNEARQVDDEAGEGASETDEDAEEDKLGYSLSLKPSRSVEFTTTEGTWLSLDLSPDGQTIIFDMLGDIYTLPISGGEATPLITGMAFDSQPVYSPDGAQIAFLSDRSGAMNLWIANADGSDPKKISSDPESDFKSAAWSADGEYIFVSRDVPSEGTNKITMYNINGGSGIDVTEAGGASVPRDRRQNSMGAEPSMDGKYLYFAHRMRNFSYNVTFPVWSISRREFKSGEVDNLVTAQGSAFKPVVSPDGTQLVYGTRYDQQTGLRIRDIESGADRWLIYPVTRDEQESMATRDVLPNYTFTPDGTEIIVAIGGKINRVSVATGTAREIPFTVNVSKELGPRLHFPQREQTGDVKARLIQGPQQSPNGRLLAYSALTNIYVSNLETGALNKITQGTPAFQPSWSADGRWLTYVTFDPKVGGHVWKIRSDGTGRPMQLTTAPALYSDPVFSPDGETIVAIRSSNYDHMANTFDFGGGAADLVKISPNRAGVELIIAARGLFSPHFGSDSDRIFLYGQEGITSMRLDGTDRKAHVAISGPPHPFSPFEPPVADDARLSPDGKFALAYVNNQLYLVTVPNIGGDAQNINVAGGSVPVKKLTEIGADYFGWADGGRTITWAIGSTYYRLALADVSFEDEAAEDGAAESEGADGAEAEEQIVAIEESNENVQSFQISVETPRNLPTGTVVLRGARIITMNGDEVIENGEIVIVSNRIQAVGEAGTLDIPSGAEVRDMTGKTIVPGFVDTHAHWFEIRRGLMDVGHWGFLANVAYGVTAGLDVQTATNDMFAYKDLIDSGQMIGPRAYSTGPGIFPDNKFGSKADVYNLMKRYRDHYGTHNLKPYLSGNREQRQWVVEAAHDLEMMPTTEGGLDLKLNITHVIDGFSGNEHSMPVFPLYEDIIQLQAQGLTAYTPTLLVSYGGPWAENWFYERENVHGNEKLLRFTPHSVIDEKALRRDAGWFADSEYPFRGLAESATRLFRSGGLVGVGSHGQLQGLGYHWELWSIASGGMTNLEALRVATLSGATIIGRELEIGSLEAGKFADLVVLNSNPLEDIRNTADIDLVMQNGRLYNGDTMDQIWPEQKPLPSQWWWNLGPNP